MKEPTSEFKTSLSQADQEQFLIDLSKRISQRDLSAIEELMEDDGKFDKNEKHLLQREYVNKKEWLDWFSKKLENEKEIQTEIQTCTFCHKGCPVLQFNSGHFPFKLPEYDKRSVSMYIEVGESGKIKSITRCEANTGSAPTAEDQRLEDEEMRRIFFFGGDMETPIEKLNTTLNFNEAGNATILTDTRPTSQGMAINLIEAYMDRVARDGQAENQAMYQQMFRDLMTPLDANVPFVVYHMYRYFSKFYHFQASVFWTPGKEQEDMSFHTELVFRECYSQMEEFSPDDFYIELYREVMRLTIKGNKYTIAGDDQSFLTALDKTEQLKPEEDCPYVKWF